MPRCRSLFQTVCQATRNSCLQLFCQWLRRAFSYRVENVNAVSQVVFVPVFDEFGYVVGGLLAQRWLRSSEELLADLAEINSFELAIVYDDKIISRANFSGHLSDLDRSADERSITANGKRAIQCGTPVSLMTVCALLPIEALTETQNELTRIGTEEEAKLLRRLFVFGLVTLLAFAAVAYLLSRQITRPLTKITKVLTGIAAGDFGGKVEGTERLDEVGDIARSVVSLQRSVRERDALRVRVHEKNTILKSKEAQLREQNVLFDAALNNMSHGLCMFDTSGRLIVSNRRYAELFQLDPDTSHARNDCARTGCDAGSCLDRNGDLSAARRGIRREGGTLRCSRIPKWSRSGRAGLC